MRGAAPLTIAVRAHTKRHGKDDAAGDETTRRRRSPALVPERVLVVDCETTTDASQRLNFGSWRFYRVPEGAGPELRCVEEGLFYGADLPERDPAGHRSLVDYCRQGAPDVDRRELDAAWRLRLLDEHAFVNDVFLRYAFNARTWVVGFNLPFDLPRLPIGWAQSRSYLPGGFALVLGRYQRDGVWCEHRWRGRLVVKTIDAKRQLMGFQRPMETDAADQIPEGDQERVEGYAFRGHLLDLRTLAFALTNRGYTLERACRDFVDPSYAEVKVAHGLVSAEYIDYNRTDVDMTGRLAARLLAEYVRHPIRLQPTKAFSPASIGKAYLRAMGVTPVLERQPDFPPEVLGHAMTAYFGGRAECRIRRLSVPVAYVDFLSMYPTVNSLMGLWDLVTSQRVEVDDDDHVRQEVHELLDGATLDGCYERDLCRGLWGWSSLSPTGTSFPSARATDRA